MAKAKSETKDKIIYPGSSVEDAKAVGGKGDFGVAEANVVERTYTSQNTKRADPGAATARSGDDGKDGSRVSGAGGNDSGPGSSSGGDLDTDVVGVGDGIGFSSSRPTDETPGPDDASGTSRDFASGKPGTGKHPFGSIKRIGGSTVQLADERSTSGQGADASANSDAGDDASAGEVSSDEASGRNDAGD